MKSLFLIFFSFCLCAGYGQEVTRTTDKKVKLPISKNLQTQNSSINAIATDTVKSEQQSVLPQFITKSTVDLQLKTHDSTSPILLQERMLSPHTTAKLPEKITAKEESNTQQQSIQLNEVNHSAAELQAIIPNNSPNLLQEIKVGPYKRVQLTQKSLQNLGGENFNEQLRVDPTTSQENDEKISGKLSQTQISNIKENLRKNQVNIKESVVVKYDDQIRTAPNVDKGVLADKLSLNPANTADVREIPEVYVDVSKDGETETSMVFFPIITNLEPLTYDSGNPEKGYKAVLSFVLYSDEGGMGQIINNPVTLEFNSSNLETAPRRVNIKHLNLPSTDIEMFSEDVKDSVDIRIITNSAPRGYTHYIRVNPILTLRTNQNKVQGLGIQEAKVIVQFRGSSSAKKEQVTVSSSVGEVEPESFTLGYNEAKTVKVRSQGLEDIVLTATTTSSNQYSISDSNNIIIRQVFPFMFLGFAIIGGILGVVIRVGFEGVKKYPLRMMGGGILMGLLGSLAYYVLGVNLLGLEVSATLNEFAVLTFSTLCSLMIQPYMLKKKELVIGEPAV